MARKNFSRNEIIEKIVDMWQPLNAEQRRLLEKNLTLKQYKKNEYIYKEGEKPSILSCLLKGKVKVSIEGVGGRNQIIRVYKPVEYFGYHAYFSGTNLITSSVALEPTVICHIPLDIIRKLISENNELALFFIKQLSINLCMADARTVSLTQKRIPARLAESILLLKESYGVEADGATLSIYLSREDMANLSNMTTSNAIRTLSSFANEKVLAIDGRKIKIIDEEKLKKISQEG